MEADVSPLRCTSRCPSIESGDLADHHALERRRKRRLYTRTKTTPMVTRLTVNKVLLLYLSRFLTAILNTLACAFPSLA